MAMEGEFGPPKQLTQDTQLSKVLFKKYSDDGWMSADQFKRMCADKGYMVLGTEQLDEAFCRLDKADDGYLRYEEFRVWWMQDGHEKRLSALEYLDDGNRRLVEEAHKEFSASAGAGDSMTQDKFRLMCYKKGYCLDDWELQDSFAKLDKNEDGEVAFVEFLRWWHEDDRFAHLKHGPEDDQAAYIQQVGDFFASYDTELKGSLTYAQFEPLYTALADGGSLSASLDEIYREVDANGDRNISLNEFIKWYTLGERWS